jgi:hypothetical protein
LRLRRNKDDESGKNEPKKDIDSEGRKSEQRKRNCFNCSLPDHVSKDCPMKTQRLKCFKCDERGHLALKCVEQPKTADAINVMQSTRKEYVKEVSIND